MSKMDETYSNPFEDNMDVNPFAAAAPKAMSPPVVSAQPVAAPPPASFNPFAAPAAPIASPAATYAPTPVITTAPATQITDSSLAAREAELQRRLAELEARERVAAEVARTGEKPKNWPVCYPLTRHAIDEDIADPVARRMVKFTYYAYLLHIVALTLNMVGALAILVSPMQSGVDTTAGSNFGISVVFWALGIPLSWVFWYRPLYNAGVKDSAAMYLIFLCMFAINIVFVGITIIGITSGGTVGFITMIQTFSIGKVPAGIICVIGIAAWGLELALDIFIIIRVYLHFRGRGGTAAVKKEAMGSAAQAAVDNPGLAVTMARAAVSSQA